MTLHRRVRRAALAAVLVCGMGVAGCQSGPGHTGADYDGAPIYLTQRPALTLNAASLEGASSDAAVLAARIYPGAMIAGPGGQMLPNTDLVGAERLPGEDTRIRYTLSEGATYSDGHPMSCDDYLLAATAAMMPEAFGSAVPVASHIAEIQCAADGRTTEVSFEPGYGQRWQQLFGPGTVLPFHTIVARAGMDPAEAREALVDRDAERLAPLIDVWRHGFDPTRPDPELQVSSGPYRLAGVSAQGDLHLAVNEYYPGDRPHIPDVYLRPGRGDVASPNEATPVLADLVDKDPSAVSREDSAPPLRINQEVSERTDSLVLASAGVMEDQEARRALASCVDSAAVAKASSDVAGMTVPWVSTRVTAPSDPTYGRVGAQVDAEAQGHPEDTEALQGRTVRVAYLAPHTRYRAMVEEMARSCAAQGITIEDVSSTKTTMADLVGAHGGEEGFVDAYLLPVDGASSYDLEPVEPGHKSSVLRTEQELWRSIPTIPLAAEPRNIVADHRVGNVVVYTGPAGIGWNMDRWRSVDHS